MDNSFETRLAACETQNTRLRKTLIRQKVMWATALLLVAGTAIANGNVSPTPTPFGAIQVQEVVFVDKAGVVRARLGGNLPDAAALDGRTMHRGSNAAGLIIYDEQGVELGGYVTQDTGSNAMLTLDSKYDQSVLLVAGPDKQQASASDSGTRRTPSNFGRTQPDHG